MARQQYSYPLQSEKGNELKGSAASDSTKSKKKKGCKTMTGQPATPIDLNPTIDEAKKDQVTFTFGRFNPITNGHRKLVEKMKSNGGDIRLYMSHSQDSKANPLSYNEKYQYAKKAFGPIVEKSNAKTIIEVLKELASQYSNITMVIGSDRTKEFKSLLERYNGKDFTFESITVISAGERDADNLSATQARDYARKGNLKEFMRMVPLKANDAKAMYEAVRRNLSEEVLTEALNLKQRIKRKQVMRRLKAKIARGRRIAKKRMANKEKLETRALRKARNVIRKKFAGKQGEHYASLSPTQKIAVDKRIESKKAAIKRIAKKLMPKVRKAEMDRLTAVRKGTQENRLLTFADSGYITESRIYGRLENPEPPPSHEIFEKGDLQKLVRNTGATTAAIQESFKDKETASKAGRNASRFRTQDAIGKLVRKKKEGTITKAEYNKLYKMTAKAYGGIAEPIPYEEYMKKFVKEATDPRILSLKKKHQTERKKLSIKHEKERSVARISRLGESKLILVDDNNLIEVIDHVLNKVNPVRISEKAMANLQKKAERTGLPLHALQSVYESGYEAKGRMTAEQAAFAKVNSYVGVRQHMVKEDMLNAIEYALIEEGGLEGHLLEEGFSENIQTILKSMGLKAHKSGEGLIGTLRKAGKTVYRTFALAIKAHRGDGGAQEELKKLLKSQVKKEDIMEVLYNLDMLSLHLVTGPIHMIDALTGWHIAPNMASLKKGASNIKDRIKAAVTNLVAAKKDAPPPIERKLTRPIQVLQKLGDTT